MVSVPLAYVCQATADLLILTFHQQPWEQLIQSQEKTPWTGSCTFRAHRRAESWKSAHIHAHRFAHILHTKHNTCAHTLYKHEHGIPPAWYSYPKYVLLLGTIWVTTCLNISSQTCHQARNLISAFLPVSKSDGSYLSTRLHCVWDFFFFWECEQVN